MKMLEQVIHRIADTPPDFSQGTVWIWCDRTTTSSMVPGYWWCPTKETWEASRTFLFHPEDDTHWCCSKDEPTLAPSN